MKCEVVADCCRVCLTKSKKLRSLYKAVDEGDEPPNEMLLKITGIAVEEMDKCTMLPKNICKNCELSLSLAFEFREKALQSQEVITSYMRELKIPFETEEEPRASVFKTICVAVKNESADLIGDQHLELTASASASEDILPDRVEILHTTTSPDSDNTAIELQLDELIMSVKGESDVADDGHEVDEFNEESLEDDTYEEVNEVFCSNLDQQQYDDMEKSVNESEGVMVDEQDDDDDDEEDLHYVEMHKEIANSAENEDSTKTWDLTQDVDKLEIDIQYAPELDVKAKQRRSRKPQSSPNQFGYICDICGNVYAKRGRMMEHRQRHDKELKYSCELCDKKFHMRELLRKHMYSHSGGKPLKCKFCSRTFYYESVRKAHEAVHKGLKPYVCDICGKAFGYGHSLKKHKLIHAEVKAYRCVYCNKDFRLQHHMTQHELTKSHQKAVQAAGAQDADNGACQAADNDQELLEDQAIVEERISNIS